jgi:hypothetical protein
MLIWLVEGMTVLRTSTSLLCVQYFVDLRHGDVVVLATDGLLDNLYPQVIDCDRLITT